MFEFGTDKILCAVTEREALAARSLSAFFNSSGSLSFFSIISSSSAFNAGSSTLCINSNFNFYSSWSEYTSIFRSNTIIKCSEYKDVSPNSYYLTAANITGLSAIDKLDIYVVKENTFTFVFEHIHKYGYPSPLKSTDVIKLDDVCSASDGSSSCCR